MHGNTLINPLSSAPSSLAPSLCTWRYGGICLINLPHKSDSCSLVHVDEWPSAGPSLYICQRRGRGSRVKRDKLGPKGRPFTFRGPPGPPPAPPSHSGARQDPQVLAGLFHFRSPYRGWSPRVFSPSFCLPQSASKRLFVRRMAHFAQALSWSFFTTELFCPLIVCLLNDATQTIIPAV